MDAYLFFAGFLATGSMSVVIALVHAIRQGVGSDSLRLAYAAGAGICFPVSVLCMLYIVLRLLV